MLYVLFSQSVNIEAWDFYALIANILNDILFNKKNLNYILKILSVVYVN